ncbi:DUF6332 family protein [Streptomyces sp. NPDC054796]
MTGTGSGAGAGTGPDAEADRGAGRGADPTSPHGDPDTPGRPGAGPRTQAERDATTVETGFAVVTGGLLAALAYFALALPVALAHPAEPGPWLLAAKLTAVTVFAARVAYVLVRWRHRARQPSQPGRTSPDS